MVLHEVWHLLDGVEALSGPHGGPLSRTVKLILDPLVIRPVQNPLCAGPIVTPDGALLLAARVRAGADVLRATAAWFTLLKQVRRALRITEGNPQDLYFQRCFELATTCGPPDPLRDNMIAEAALRDVHEFAAGRTTAALKEYVTDPVRAGQLAGLIDLAWRRRPHLGASGSDHARLVADLLDRCATARVRHERDNGQAAFDRLLAAHAGTRGGIALWQAMSGDTARELGLTAHPAPAAPELGASASKSTLGLPFDRTIYERVFTALQTVGERAELPPIPELVTTEIARSCSPWALLDESLRVAATAGAALALGLCPIDTPTAVRGADNAAQRIINGRWRREAYVLRARRLVVSTDGESSPHASPLTAIAAELRTPWRPYLRRLWVRLHGRDVREFSVAAADELWDLLDGVARSVILDHRMRVKQALSVSFLATEPDSTTSRAS